jgi:hypothetical protein
MNGRIISEPLIINNTEGRGSGLSAGTCLTFSSWEWGNSQNISCTIAGLRAEIWTRNFPNTKASYPLDRDSLYTRSTVLPLLNSGNNITFIAIGVQYCLCYIRNTILFLLHSEYNITFITFGIQYYLHYTRSTILALLHSGNNSSGYRYTTSMVVIMLFV